jgi:hypothetical protein
MREDGPSIRTETLKLYKDLHLCQIRILKHSPYFVNNIQREFQSIKAQKTFTQQNRSHYYLSFELKLTLRIYLKFDREVVARSLRAEREVQPYKVWKV